MAAFLSIATALATAAHAQEPAPPAGPLALDHPAIHQGDAPASLRAILDALDAAPTDAATPLLLVELRQAWSFVVGGKLEAAKRLQALADRMPPSPLQDDVLAALAELRRSEGDVEAVKAIQLRRGFLRDWLVTGAFGIAPGGSLDEPFGPELAAGERDVDPRERFHGLRATTEVGWAPVELEPVELSVTLSRGTTARGAVGYAMTHVELPAAGSGYLVYTGPSARVWLNRTLVTSIDRARERLDQELMIPVRFAQGWNRILMKLADGRAARFTLRLTDDRGAPLFGRTSVAPQPVAVGGGERTPPRSSDGLTRLAVETAPGRQALYAQALAITQRGEEAWTVLEDLRRSTPALERAAWFCLLLGDVAQRADHLPQAARRDQARSAYERALAADPRCARARRRLADFAFDDDRTKDGILLLEETIAHWPNDLGARLRLVDVLVRKGWLLDAEEALEEAARLGPLLPPVLEARISLLEARQMEREAAAVREQLYEADRGEAWALLRRMQRAVAEGDRARADEALDALIAQGWSRFEALARRIDVARAFGDREGELAARRERVAARPWDLDLHVELAEAVAEGALESPGARAEAVSILEAVVAQEPGRHKARRLLLALRGEGDGEDRFWAEWEPDALKVIAEAPPDSHWPRASTACLFDQTVTRVYPDGSAVDVVHQIFRILDEGGKERYGSRPRGGELLTVRTITRGGEVLEPINAGRTYEMPGLAAGACVEHAFKVERDAAVFQYENGPFYFMDPDLTEPFWLSRWVILLHEDAPVTLVQRNMDRRGITHEVQHRGEWVAHIFTARDQPRFEVEPLSPDRDELLPWVRLVERRTLEDLGAFCQEVARSGVVVTTQIARKAAEVTFDLDDDAQKAEALYRFVQDHVTRAGDRGSETAAQVLSSRAGSKTALYLALLEAANVPHRVLLAGPSPLQADPIDWTLPEAGHYRTRLVRIEPRGGAPRYIYADAPKLAPFGRLPAELWGAPAYVCEPGGGGVLEALPMGAFADEEQRGETRIALQQGGKARVEVVKVLPGFGLFQAKEAFASAPAARVRDYFARLANELFPGPRVIESGGVQLETPGAPLQFRILFDVPQAVRARGDGTLALPLGFSPGKLKDALGGHRQREFDIVLKEPIVLRDTVRIDLGPYACPRLPANATLQMRLASYTLLHVREGEGRLRLERLLLVQPGRIPPAEYPAFREFLGQVDEVERRTLPLELRTP